MQPNPSQTARGHEEPFALQFSIFMPNRVGQFCEILDTFEKNNIELAGISVVDSAEWAVIRMVFTDPNHAREVLKLHSHDFIESHILLVEIHDDDTLRQVCSCLLQAEINVHFVYPLTIQSHGNPVMVFHVDDNVIATQVLTKHNLILLGSEDLFDPGGMGEDK